MDGARVIPLHGDLAGRLQRAGRRDTHRTARPQPGPAQVLPLTPAAEVASPTDIGPVGRWAPAWEHRLAGALTFLRRRLEGTYDVDEFGFDPDLTAHVLLPAVEPLYRHWFRVEVAGTDNLPPDGGALLVANHAGGLWPLDVAMTALAVHLEHPGGRFLRVLGDDLLFRLPGLGAAARKAGATVPCVQDADRLLAAGELVGAWPEGIEGLGKPFALRYRLQHFERSAYVASAIRAQVPIIPVSIVGAEETHPVLAQARTVARLLGVPQFPVTPTFPWLGPLGLLPLPTKWHIEFGAPLDTTTLDPQDADDPAAVFELADQVRETVQSSLFRLLGQRRSVWR